MVQQFTTNKIYILYGYGVGDYHGWEVIEI
jgi:hypothetical protein